MTKTIFAVAFTVLALVASAIADPVPSNRRIDWTSTGVPGGIPNRTTICATFSPGATAAAINSAINACNNGVVFLNAGTFTSAALRGTIQVYKSNVTLRGAGADQTILTGLNIINLGNGSNVSLGTAITGGATKDSRAFTVASTANLSVGTMIEIDRADDTNLIVNTGDQGGGTRNMTQVNMITAVSGNTVTVRNPLIYDFSAGSPRVKFYFAGITRSSGVENLKVDHAGFSGGNNFFIQYCDGCWLKGVESGRATGYHFVVLGTLNMEIRDSYIHEGASGPDNSGANFYGNYLYGANSSAKIENNIFNKNFPAIELNGSSSGFYIGYNYSHGSPSQSGTNLVTWTFDDGHAPFNIMNLYEGNIGEMWGADNYFGGSGYGTALRNYFTGFNPNFGETGDAVWLDRLAYNYNLVGNVLGSANQKPTAYTGCDSPAIYRLGYPNLGNCSTTPHDGFSPPGGYPDAKVIATLLRWGNYDYFNKATRFVASEIPTGVTVPPDQVIPNSYYYNSGTPAWWPTGIVWPPIGPDVTGGNGDTSGHVNKIPAQVCWETRNLLNGGLFNASACYAGGSGGSQKAVLTTPPPGSTLSGSSVTFGWTVGSGVSEYWFQVGTTAGGANLFDSSTGTNRSATVNNLPTDGRQLFVRLWSLISGSWQFNDYSYTAATIAAQKAVLTTPPPGSTLSGASVTFGWTAGTGVSEYWLTVGTTAGGANLFDSSTATNRSATVNNLPTDGRQLFVRLWSLISGSWQFNDYSYTAATIAAQKAVLTTPAPGSTLSGASVTFGWTAGTGVSEYWLTVGTTAGGANLFDSSTATNRSATVNNLPTDGRQLFVRLWSLTSGTWQFNEYSYTAGPKAAMTTPAPQSGLSSPSMTLGWSSGSGVSQYWLHVGTAAGAADLYDQSTGTAKSATVNGLPIDGRTVYVRLWSLLNNTWQFNDYTYTATGAGGRPLMTTPTPGFSVPGTSVAFGWSAGSGVSQYWLNVGSTSGGTDLFNQSTGTSQSRTVSGLPSDGRILYVRLWSLLANNSWQFNDYTYGAATGGVTTMTTN